MQSSSVRTSTPFVMALKGEVWVHIKVAVSVMASSMTLTGLSLVMADNPSHIAWYPGSGVLFSALLIAGARYAPVGFFAATLSQWLLVRPPMPLPVSVVIGAVYALSAAAAVTLVRRLGLDLGLRRLQDVVLLLAAVGLGPTVFAAGISWLTLLRPTAGYLSFNLLVWSGMAVSLVSVVPFLLLAVGGWWARWCGLTNGCRHKRSFHLDRTDIQVMFGTAAVVVAGLSLANWTHQRWGFNLHFLCFLPLAWLTARRSLDATVATLLCVNTSVLFLVAALGSVGVGLTNFRITMFSISATALFLSASNRERRTAQQRLAESDQALTLALATARVGIWEYDRVTDTVTWSGIAAEDLGVAASGSAPAAEVLQLIPPADHEELRGALTRSATGGGRFSCEVRLSSPGHSTVWVATQGAVRFDSSGRIARISGVFQEITERKMAAEAVRQSEQRYRSLVSATASVITIGDGKARFCSPQQSWQRFTGQTWEQQRGWKWQDAIHPEDRSELWRRWTRDAPAGRVVEGEVRIWHAPDAAYRYMQIRAVPIKDEDGQVIEWVGAFIDIEDRVRFEQIQRRMVSILESTTDLVGTAHPGGRVLYLNQAARRMMELSESADVTGTQIWDYHPPWVRLIVEQGILSAQANGVWRGETVLLSTSGKQIPVSQVILAHTAPDGTLGYLSTICRDVTEERRVQEELRASEQRYVTLVNSIDGIVWSADPNTGHFSFVSMRAERLLGYPTSQWIEEPRFWLDHIHGEDRPWVESQWRAIGSRTSPQEIEYRMIAADGRMVWLRDLITVVREDGQPVVLRGVMIDTTATRRLQEEMVKNALHDPLTQLANRGLFEESLSHALRRQRRHEGSGFAVLFLDLDRFKLVNDTLGHLAGDRLLTQVAGRLAECCRETDTVARFGGDEFAVLLEDQESPGQAMEVARRIQAAISQPVVVESHEFFPSASIGIAHGSPEYHSAREILRNADIAMYRAKQSGRGCAVVFDSRMHLDVVTAAKLQRDLRRSMERGEFENHYQEILSLENGRLAGFECLLRWRHADRGLLAPSEFLEVAEETGVLLNIGWLSLSTACRDLAKWRKRAGMEHLTVSVNLSGRQFIQPDLVERLSSALSEAGLPGTALKVEITETVIMENVVVAADEMRRIQALGVGLLIDDFGTGYSSLSRLKDLPIDAIKIDRSFIQALHDAGSASIVKSIIALGANLGLRVIAEGVETLEQKNSLAAFGCDYLQGYFVSRPLSAADTEARMAAHSRPV